MFAWDLTEDGTESDDRDDDGERSHKRQKLGPKRV